jgi:hypothetical protein
MTGIHFSRREFLQTAAGVAGASLAARTVFLDPVSQSIKS